MKKAVITKENIEIGWFIRFSTPTQVLHDLGRECNNYLILFKKVNLLVLSEDYSLVSVFL